MHKRLLGFWFASALFALIGALWLGRMDATPAPFSTPLGALDEQTFVPPVSIANLHEAADLVSRLDEADTDPSGTGEYKNRAFFEQHKGKWTVQLMDVRQLKLITDYLERQKDRQGFMYFRYTDVHNTPHFVLIHGIYDNAQMAWGATRTHNFNLPSSAVIIPEEINRYLSIIDNYSAEETSSVLNESILPDANEVLVDLQMPKAAPAPTVENADTEPEADETPIEPIEIADLPPPPPMPIEFED